MEGPTAPAKDPWGNTRIGVSAITKINRKDFGLTWNATLETGGILVGEEVTITLDVAICESLNSAERKPSDAKSMLTAGRKNYVAPTCKTNSFKRSRRLKARE